MDEPVFRRPAVPAEPTMRERILDAAVKCFAAQGVSNTSMKTVAAAAGVSVGSVQHYFGNKAGLVAAVDEYVLDIFGRILESSPMPEPPAEHLTELRGRFAQLVVQYPEVMEYVAHALCEDEKIGAVIFDGLLRITQAQGAKFTEHGLTRDDLDPVWGPIHPLILHIGAIMLRKHIERHIPGPFFEREQLARWEKSVLGIIRRGQFKPGAVVDE